MKSCKDLMAAIKEVYPYLEREQYSLYCRYNGSELYPILDHMTMVTAYSLMDAHASPLLYLIRKDISEWVNNHPELMKNPSDIKLLFEAKHSERWSTEYNGGRANHVPDEGPDGARVTSGRRKRSSSGSRKGSGGRRSSRKSLSRRKSSRRGSRKSMKKKSMDKRQSKTKK